MSHHKTSVLAKFVMNWGSGILSSLLLGLLCLNFAFVKSEPVLEENTDLQSEENAEGGNDIDSSDFFITAFSSIVQSKLGNSDIPANFFLNPIDEDSAADMSSSIAESLVLEVGIEDSLSATDLIVEALFSVMPSEGPEAYCAALADVAATILLSNKILDSENYFALSDIISEIILNVASDLISGENNPAPKNINKIKKDVSVDLNIRAKAEDNVLDLQSNSDKNLDADSDSLLDVDANVDLSLKTNVGTNVDQDLNNCLNVSEEAKLKFKLKLTNELLKDINFRNVFSDYIPSNLLKQIAAFICQYISKAFHVSRLFLLPLEFSIGTSFDSPPTAELYINIITSILTDLFGKAKFITKGTASLQATIAANAIRSGIASLIRIAAIPGVEFGFNENTNSYFAVLNGLEKLSYVGIHATSPKLPLPIKLLYASKYASQFAKILFFNLLSSSKFLEIFSFDVATLNNKLSAKTLGNFVAEAFGSSNPNLFFDLYCKALLTSPFNANSVNYARALSFATTRALFFNAYFLSGNINIQAAIAKNAIIRALTTRTRPVATQVPLYPIGLPWMTQLEGVLPSQILLKYGTDVELNAEVDNTMNAKINAVLRAGMNENSDLGVGISLNPVFGADLGINVGPGRSVNANVGLEEGLFENVNLEGGLGASIDLGDRINGNIDVEGGLDSNIGLGEELSATVDLGGKQGANVGFGEGLNANLDLGERLDANIGLGGGLGSNAAISGGLGTSDGLAGRIGTSLGLPGRLGANVGLGVELGKNVGLRTGLGINAGLVNNAGPNVGLGTNLGTGTGSGVVAGVNTGLGTVAGVNTGLGEVTGVNAGLRTVDGWKNGLGGKAGWNNGLAANAGWNNDLGTVVGWNNGLRSAAGVNTGLGAVAGLNSGLGANARWNNGLGTVVGWNNGLRSATGVNTGLGAVAGLNTGLGENAWRNNGLGTVVGWNNGLRSATGVNTGLGAATGLNTGLRAGINTGFGAGLDVKSGSGTGLDVKNGLNAGLDMKNDLKAGLDMKNDIGVNVGLGGNGKRKKRSIEDLSTSADVDLGISAAADVELKSDEASGAKIYAELDILDNNFKNAELLTDESKESNIETNLDTSLDSHANLETNTNLIATTGSTSNAQLSVLHVLPLILANKLYQSTALYTSVSMVGVRKIISLISQAMATEFGLTIGTIFLRSYNQFAINNFDNSFEMNMVGLAKATTEAIACIGLLNFKFSLSTTNQLADTIVAKFSSLIATSLETNECTERPQWTYLLDQDLIQPPLIPRYKNFK